jgi:hypothetical protein
VAACPFYLLRDIDLVDTESMRLLSPVYLLMIGVAYGQIPTPATSPASAATSQASAVETKVAPGDPVITLNGFCTEPTPPGTACQTVISRAQFEKLAEALQPGMSPALRLNLANAYARNVRMAAAAEKRGLDKTPAFEEEMRFARMQLLSQDLSHALQADANNITDADFEDYYNKNEATFEQATLARIFVPRATKTVPARQEQKAESKDAGPAGAQSAAQTKSAEDAMTKVATDLRARAANGEDFDKLQIEAYAQAGFERTAPNTKMEKVRRDTLPPQHETVLDLKPGEVSEVFSDPSGAHFIYKMISKQTPPLDAMKPEIRTAISTQRYRDSMKPFQGDVVFSDAYFNAPGSAATPPQRTRKGRATNPPAQPADDH